MSTAEVPAVILLAGSPAHQRALEQAGYRVLRVSEAERRPALRVLQPPRQRARTAPQPADANGNARSMLVPMSRAARLLRASVYALGAWQERGWLTRFPAPWKGQRLIDLREVLLLVWLHNGVSCVSPELAATVGTADHAMNDSDACWIRVSEWKRRLNGSAAERFEDALRVVHEHGYSCLEVEACVARLAFTPKG